MYPFIDSYPLIDAFHPMSPYGSLTLTEASPPQSFVEPLGVDEVASYLKCDSTDADLPALISAARSQAEFLQGRDLVRKQWDLSLDYWTGWRIDLRDPTVSVDLVKYRDFEGTYTTMVADLEYIADLTKHPGCIMPPFNHTWPLFTPWPSSSITVRFTSGFTADSVFWLENPLVKMGMKLLISQWYDNRLPFVTGLRAAEEYPFQVTAGLSQGALLRAR